MCRLNRWIAVQIAAALDPVELRFVEVVFDG